MLSDESFVLLGNEIAWWKMVVLFYLLEKSSPAFPHVEHKSLNSPSYLILYALLKSGPTTTFDRSVWR